MKLEIFEPSLCCESGVCGPEPDKVLIDLQNTIQLLKKVGIETKRYAINQAPVVFVQNAVVRDFIKANGPGKLPLVLLDSQIVKSGGYPTINELKVLIPELNGIEPDTKILGIFS
ncbi:MAG: arsenite efflux transporter metallochaperone ArsD [Cyclobacteriaceae bacterium]|nr:arsenite efflux transporter metallochaperone ArsD [Cyclobacteriaceae bacterium]